MDTTLQYLVVDLKGVNADNPNAFITEKLKSLLTPDASKFGVLDISDSSSKYNSVEIVETLRNYPVVYVHTWEWEDDKLSCYIGETNDLFRRAEEHEAKGKDDLLAWQNTWKNKPVCSFFFSSPNMNKSLTLDLEDSLFKLLKNALPGAVWTNGRGNPQTGYSNKNLRDDLLKGIWDVLFEKLNGYEKSESRGENDIFPILDESQMKHLSEGKCAGDFNNIDDLVVYEGQMKNYSSKDELEKAIRSDPKFAQDKGDLLLKYPVVYLHVWKDSRGKLHTYAGETNDLARRTMQHLNYGKSTNDKKTTDSEETADNSETVKGKWHFNWQKAVKEGTDEKCKAYMFVFGRRDMSISVTRDIENLLISYTVCCGLSTNGRGNPQREYYEKEKMYPLFREIVAELIERSKDKNDNKNDTFYELFADEDERFLTLDEIKKQAAFIASPLHELSEEQEETKSYILGKINDAIENTTEGKRKVLIVSGTSGTGKTVLAASLFFDLIAREDVKVRFQVNHDELAKLYRDAVENFCLATGGSAANFVGKPNDFLDVADVDVSLVDEAHLLLYSPFMRGEPSLKRTVRNSRVTLLLVDPEQYCRPCTLPEGVPLPKDQADEEEMEEFYREQLRNNPNEPEDLSDLSIDIEFVATLKQQFRMQCSDSTRKWIRSICQDGGKIEPFPVSQSCANVLREDENLTLVEVNEEIEREGERIPVKYEIGVFESVKAMNERIQKKKSEGGDPAALLATYCWNKDIDLSLSLDSPFVGGDIYRWHKAKGDPKWTMQPVEEEGGKKVYEVGSIHNIQGRDLNYAGVVLGPSIAVKGGKVVIKEENRIKTTKPDDWDILTENEINVLLTRGAKGLYIYAVDDKLCEALKKAIKDGWKNFTRSLTAPQATPAAPDANP